MQVAWTLSRKFFTLPPNCISLHLFCYIENKNKRQPRKKGQKTVNGIYIVAMHDCIITAQHSSKLTLFGV